MCAPACAPRRVPPAPPDPTVPAQRAAQSWVHCLEQNGGACVSNYQQFASWDAYALLGWLASGSPTSILAGLRQELQHHRDERSVQRRMIAISDAAAAELRGAECRSVDVMEFTDVIPKLEEAAKARMRYFGLLNGQMETIIQGLVAEATDGLNTGYFVTMECVNEPYATYVAAAEHENHYIVAGMMLELPDYLGGSRPIRSRDTGELLPMRTGVSKATETSAVEGTVHPWINIVVEEF
jgi:hypothetical protein